MGRVYSFSVDVGAQTTTRTGISLTAASGKPLRLLSASITNATNETNEQLVAGIRKISSDGTATTATSYITHNPDDASATATLKHTYTAEPTYATPVGIIEGFSSLGGWYWNPTEKEQIIVGSAEIIGIRIVTATFTSLQPVFRLTWEEMT